MHGVWIVCDEVCQHWHDPVDLRANLGTLGEHMYLEYFACVYSYVGIAWPDAWFMGAQTLYLCCKSQCISYILHCMVSESDYDEYGGYKRLGVCVPQ